MTNVMNFGGKSDADVFHRCRSDVARKNGGQSRAVPSGVTAESRQGRRSALLERGSVDADADRRRECGLAVRSLSIGQAVAERFQSSQTLGCKRFEGHMVGLRHLGLARGGLGGLLRGWRRRRWSGDRHADLGLRCRLEAGEVDDLLLLLAGLPETVELTPPVFLVLEQIARIIVYALESSTGEGEQGIANAVLRGLKNGGDERDHGRDGLVVFGDVRECQAACDLRCQEVEEPGHVVGLLIRAGDDLDLARCVFTEALQLVPPALAHLVELSVVDDRPIERLTVRVLQHLVGAVPGRDGQQRNHGHCGLEASVCPYQFLRVQVGREARDEEVDHAVHVPTLVIGVAAVGLCGGEVAVDHVLRRHVSLL